MELRRMGIRTVMVTGDNPLTAAAIAAEAGVDDFLAQATPEEKTRADPCRTGAGKLVAMCGDGPTTHRRWPRPMSGAMNTGTRRPGGRQHGRSGQRSDQADRDRRVGKQLLMTRGALTTFSIANDVGKVFRHDPAMFIAFYPQLGALNMMRLENPESAILSAIIFNALIIVVLIPLALRGVQYRPISARRSCNAIC